MSDFAGVLHIHGALSRDPARSTELVLSDQDFGEFYLRRRIVPDFIYDAARLYHLVLVGYSANDPPMRYLLNAVAADGTRFNDLKERFTFIGTRTADPVALEDWKARGITPIQYNSANDHAALSATLARWANLSAINGKKTAIDAEIRQIVKTSRNTAPEQNRDLFDHLIRRSNASERVRLSGARVKSGRGPRMAQFDHRDWIGKRSGPAAMISPWPYLDEDDRSLFRATIAFLEGRLARSDTIDWALRLKNADRIKKIAIAELLSAPHSRLLEEPWRTTWRLIEESWSSSDVPEGASMATHDAQARLGAGDRSGALVDRIVDIVAPRLKVEPIEEIRWKFVKRPRTPKTFDDLLSNSCLQAAI